MYASMLLSILMAGAPDVVPQPNCDNAHAWSDFDQTHGELGLVGAAPLYGTDDERATGPAVEVLNAQTAAPSGAAPLFGLEALPASPARPGLTGDSIR
jgi:hypothetical protein